MLGRDFNSRGMETCRGSNPPVCMCSGLSHGHSAWLPPGYLLARVRFRSQGPGAGPEMASFACFATEVPQLLDTICAPGRGRDGKNIEQNIERPRPPPASMGWGIEFLGRKGWHGQTAVGQPSGGQNSKPSGCETQRPAYIYIRRPLVGHQAVRRCLTTCKLTACSPVASLLTTLLPL